MKKTKSKKKKILIAIAVCVLVLLVVGWGAFCVIMYNDNLNIRGESYEPLMLRTEDFEGLNCAEYSFSSDRGQKLAGYLYSTGENQRGIVVMAHGFGGGGHNSYMDCADWFARNGYYVFAYDATGTDRSEGDGTCGAPQGVIDLDYAISFVEACGDIPDLPIVLFGHSWGAYSVSAVLSFHPEVRAVIACSGFNRSSDMFESGGKEQAGAAMDAMLPFVRAYERIRFGKYASATALDGFASTDASVMIVHSADDNVIGIGYGYDRYYEKYKDDPRFTFIRFEDRGHNDIFREMDTAYRDEINAEFARWVEALDYKPEEDKERFAGEKAAYIAEHVDRVRLNGRPDEELFARFLDFYDRAVR